MSEGCKSTEATARALVAQAEHEARLAAARRSMADTSSTGAEPSFAAPPVEAGLTSADLVRWAERMEVEISHLKGATDAKVNELNASVSSMRDGWSPVLPSRLTLRSPSNSSWATTLTACSPRGTMETRGRALSLIHI